MDVNVRAFKTVQAAIAGDSPSNTKKESSRRGGLKGGRSRAMSMSRERRVEIAKKANRARWSRNANGLPKE